MFVSSLKSQTTFRSKLLTFPDFGTGWLASRSAMNFLDVNDLATVNKILEETARLHQQQQKELVAEEKLSKTKMGSKDEKDGKGNMNSVALNLRIHF